MSFLWMMQAAQCLGRVIRSKTDYGIIIFADSRYNRREKREKLPAWVQRYLGQGGGLNLSIDEAIFRSKQFLRDISQSSSSSSAALSSILLGERDIEELAHQLRRHQDPSLPKTQPTAPTKEKRGREEEEEEEEEGERPMKRNRSKLN